MSIGNMMYYWSIGNMMYYWSIGNMMYYWCIGRNGKVWTYQQQPGTPMYDKIIRNAHIRQKSKADLFLATVPIEHSFFICSVVSLRQILPTSGCEPITSCEPLMLIFTDIGEVELLPLYLWLWTYNQLWTDNVNIYWHRESRASHPCTSGLKMRACSTYI